MLSCWLHPVEHWISSAETRIIPERHEVYTSVPQEETTVLIAEIIDLYERFLDQRFVQKTNVST